MQILTLRAAAFLLIAPVFTGCAALQEDMTETDPVEGPVTSFDYIDDRAPSEPADEEFVIEDFEDEFEEEDLEPLRLIRQLSLQIGVRDFSDDAIFGRVDSEMALGIEYAHEIKNGLGFEVGGLGSLSTENGIESNPDVTGAAAEIYGGARYWFKGNRRWTPYIGGGVAAILAGVDNDQGGQVADDQDFSLGLYAHGGVQYDVNDFLFLGVDLRTLFATDLELETVSGDADYVQLLLMVGFRL